MSSQPRTRPHEAERFMLIVELFRERGEKGGDQFSCTLAEWNFLRELGKTFGWHPIGTTYLPQKGQPARHKPIKHDYQPGDSEDRKRVESDDSAQWAATLDRARRSPFISGMLHARAQLQESESTSSAQALESLLNNFIEFARRGSFTIALRRGL